MINQKIKILTLIILLLQISAVTAENKSDEIIIWNRLSDNPVSYKILKLALDKTIKEYGMYSLKSSIPMEQGRVMAELKSNQRVHIASFAPTNKRETELLPIRIPVTRGLLGLRVCLIKKDKQSEFLDIKTLQDFINKDISIGQGKHWPDTAILEANNLKVIKSAKYTPLFEMLIKDRFKCFSRSVSEVLPELDKYKDTGLTLEKNLLLVYRLPTFFFVSNQNKPLAARIEKGLQLANKDGSFDRVIRNAYKKQFRTINIKNRKIITLKNPFLSQQTKLILQNKSLWFNPLIKTDKSE